MRVGGDDRELRPRILIKWISETPHLKGLPRKQGARTLPKGEGAARARCGKQDITLASKSASRNPETGNQNSTLESPHVNNMETTSQRLLPRKQGAHTLPDGDGSTISDFGLARNVNQVGGSRKSKTIAILFTSISCYLRHGVDGKIAPLMLKSRTQGARTLPDWDGVARAQRRNH